MARLMIDMDGVLANFVRGMVGIANGIWPGRLSSTWEPSGWNFTEEFTKEEFDRMWKIAMAKPNFWLSLDAYTENVGALKQFIDTKRNHDIWFVTARSPSEGLTVSNQTHRWLDLVGLVRVGPNYTGVMDVKTGAAKTHIIRALEIDASIDDRGDAVMQYQELPNHRAALLDRPWNQEYKPKWRVSSLQQFLDSVA